MIRVGICFGSMGLLVASSLAWAQTPAALEEVVVTAQKRSENLQEIPKQVQVVTTENLQTSNITGLADLVKLVPSISGHNTNAMGGLTSMRGVGTAAPSTAAQS